MTDIVIWIVALLCMALGLVGSVLPLLPGAPLVFLGTLIAAWVDDFQRIGWRGLLTIGLLALAAMSADLIATSLGAKRQGASGKAIAGAAIGTVIGIFFGPVGILLGPFLGAAAGELIARRNLTQAGRVGIATWIGLLIGGAAKFAIALSMIAIFFLARL